MSDTQTMLTPSFILFEGIDGTGKTTQAQRLTTTLQARGMKVQTLREPTQGPWGMRIRRAAAANQRPDAVEELRWFVEDRRGDVECNIVPALEAGEVVVLDRYFYSTAAYQGARNNPAASTEAILALNRSFAPEPDLVIWLRLAPDKALKRVAERCAPDGFENASYLERVQTVYESVLRHAAEANRLRLAVIDAAMDQDQVAAAVQKAVDTWQPLDFSPPLLNSVHSIGVRATGPRVTMAVWTPDGQLRPLPPTSALRPEEARYLANRLTVEAAIAETYL